ncbi:MAG: hypothetical protein ABGX27_07025, partial [Desulfurobacteriaceae bacterium]
NESDEEYIKEYALKKGIKIANMIAHEKFPLPSDKKRLWNETLAIEEAEKDLKEGRYIVESAEEHFERLGI